ncbi:MAG: type II toxin-antitoxin system RelE/ParE family toxin [Zoogloea sp.]|nr:type II toxin-antitoxin system RelE/ParE family toxin [Zoogloea sp.]MCA0187431.1 type II toxin-antitoxin system RelE/ParE family toxin [Pseudomonadota bacterium]
MNFRVVFSPEAEEQLAALYRYIAAAASPDIAARYTEAILGYCESLKTFPNRGILRDDIRPGLRITHYRKRTVIAFDVDTGVVSIIGLFYGGQDYATILQDDTEDDSSH